MTTERRLRSRLPPVFESLAYLYGPADPGFRTLIVEAGDRWAAAPGARARRRRPALGPARPERAPVDGRDPVRGPAGAGGPARAHIGRRPASDSRSCIDCRSSRAQDASGERSAPRPSGALSPSWSEATVRDASSMRSRSRLAHRRSVAACVPAAMVRPSGGSSSTTDACGVADQPSSATPRTRPVVGRRFSHSPRATSRWCPDRCVAARRPARPGRPSRSCPASMCTRSHPTCSIRSSGSWRRCPPVRRASAPSTISWPRSRACSRSTRRPCGPSRRPASAGERHCRRC